MKIFKITLIAIMATVAISCDQKNNDAATTTNKQVETSENMVDANGVDHTGHNHDMVENTEAVNPEEAAVLSLDQDIYDFGEVQAGSTTEKVIEFTNTGKTPLVIQSASASCGCTVPEYSKEPVAPGETGQLTVSFAAPTINGMQTKTVTLNTNSAKKIETFRIKANVVGGNNRTAPQAPAQQLPTPNLGEVN